MNEKQVKPANPLVEVIGESLERIHAVPSDVPNLKADYKSVVLCFSNGRSIHLDAECHVTKEGLIPVIRSRDGDWEMLKAAPEERTDFMQRMPEVEPSRELGTPDLHEIDRTGSKLR